MICTTFDKNKLCVSLCLSVWDDTSTTPPVYEAVQQLFAGAVLCHQHQIARRDVGFVQSHDLFIVKGFQDLVLLQDFLLVLLTVGNDLCHVDFACSVFSALPDHSKPTSGKKVCITWTKAHLHMISDGWWVNSFTLKHLTVMFALIFGIS